MCDGCGCEVESTANLPLAWLRLTVTGRADGRVDVVNVATVEICEPECAETALRAAREAVRVKPIQQL